MFLLFLSLSIKLHSRFKTESDAFTNDCTIEGGVVGTINAMCEEYNYISSECVDCDVDYTEEASVNFYNCTFMQTGMATLINLKTIYLKIYDSSYVLSYEAAKHTSIRFIKMSTSNLHMRNMEMSSDHYQIVQMLPNIESRNPQNITIFDLCTFININCNSQSGCGISIISEDQNEFAKVNFIECNIFNTSSKNEGGFFYQSDNMGTLIIDCCTFNNCFAENGGSLFISTEFILKNTIFVDCGSGKSGNILYIKNSNLYGDLIISNCSFKQSQEIYSIIEIVLLNDIPMDSLTFENCMFQENNYVTESILGIVTNGMIINMIFCDCFIIENNNAKYSIIIAKQTSLNLTRCKFINNSSNNVETIGTENCFLYIFECLFDQKTLSAIKSNSDKTQLINTTFRHFKKDFTFIGSLIFFFEGLKINIIGCKFFDIAGEDHGGLGIGYHNGIQEILYKNCIIENSYGDHRPTGIITPSFVLQNMTIEGCQFINCTCQKGSIIHIADLESIVCRITAKFINTSFYKCHTIEKLGMIKFLYKQETSKLLIVGCSFDTLPPDETIVSGTLFQVYIKDTIFTNSSKLINLNIAKFNLFMLDGVHIYDCESEGPLIVICNSDKIVFKNCVFENIQCTKNNFIELVSMTIPIDLFVMNNCTFQSIQYSRNGFNLDVSSLNILDCSFINNTAEYGAGLYIMPKTYIIIEDCTFIGNSVSKSGACLFFEAQNNYETKNIIAFNNTAEESGAFIHMYDVYDNKLPSFIGSGNVSPNGNYLVQGENIMLNDFSINDVVFKNAKSLIINGGTNQEIDIRIYKSYSIELNTLKIKNLEAEGKSIILNSNTFENSKKISLKLSSFITIENSSFRNSPDIIIEASALLINYSKFKYSRKSEEQSQIHINSTTDVTIQNSCFKTDSNQFGSGDFIRSKVHSITLSIDGSSCFNTDFVKSISIPENSTFSFGDSFNCDRNCFLSKIDEEQKMPTTRPKQLELAISISIVVVILVVIIVLVIIFLKKRDKKESSISDSKLTLEEMPDIDRKVEVISVMVPISVDHGIDYFIDFEES